MQRIDDTLSSPATEAAFSRGTDGMVKCLSGKQVCRNGVWISKPSAFRCLAEPQHNLKEGHGASKVWYWKWWGFLCGLTSITQLNKSDPSQVPSVPTLTRSSRLHSPLIVPWCPPRVSCGQHEHNPAWHAPYPTFLHPCRQSNSVSPHRFNSICSQHPCSDTCRLTLELAERGRGLFLGRLERLDGFRGWRTLHLHRGIVSEGLTEALIALRVLFIQT